ncbi:MAG: capsule assembly Wzi family protein [Nitrospirota bacterium]|jgi:hypothetical protein
MFSAGQRGFWVAVLIAVSLLAAPVGGWCTASPEVPLDHWAYRTMDRLNALGVIETAFQGQRPWTRAEFARLIEEGGRSRKPLQTATEAQLLRLREEFSAELETRHGAWGKSYAKPAERVAMRIFASSGEPEATLQHGDTLTDGFDVRLDWQAHGRLGTHLIAAIRPEVRWGSGDSVPLRQHGLNARLPAVDDPDAKIELRESYLKLVLWNLELEAGRDHIWWGPGRRGSLLLTDNAEPLDLVKLSNPEPVLLPWFLRYLGPLQVEWFWTELEHARKVPRAQLTGLRFDFKPTPNWEVGLARVIQFGGHGRPDLFDEGPWDILTGANAESGTADTENSIAAIDLSWRIAWPRPAQLYWEFGGEDQADLLSTIPFFSALGHVVGIYLPEMVPGVPVDLRVEYLTNTQDTRPFWYRHGTYKSGYTYRGKILGHPFGGEAEAVSVRVDWFSVDGWELGFDADWVSNKVKGGGEEKDLRVGADARLFTQGVAQYAVRYDFESRSDVDGVSGEDDTSHRVMVEMALDL